MVHQPDKVERHLEHDDAVAVSDVESLFNHSRGDEDLAASRVEIFDCFTLPTFPLPAHGVNTRLTNHRPRRQLGLSLLQVLGQKFGGLLCLHEHQGSRARVYQGLLKELEPLRDATAC